MSWYRFWKSGERYCDRLYTASTTMMILKVGGYLPISWLIIWLLLLAAFVGDVLFGFLAGEVENETGLVTRNAKTERT